MEAKRARIYLRGIPEDGSDVHVKLLAFVELTDHRRLILICLAAVSRMLQGKEWLMNPYDAMAERARLVDGMMTAVGNLADGLDGDSFSSDITSAAGYTLAVEVGPCDPGVTKVAEIELGIMEGVVELAGWKL